MTDPIELLAAAAKLLNLGPHEACGCKDCTPFVAERRELQHAIHEYLKAFRSAEETLS